MSIFRRARSRLTRALIATLILSATIATAVYLTRRPLIPAAPPEEAITSGGDALTVERIQQTSTRDGRLEWSLDAASAQYVLPDKKMLLKELAVTFFTQDGQRVFLTSANGMVKTDSHDMDAHDDVVITNDSYRLETERIHYAQATRTITSETPVTITGQAGELTADSLSVDLNTHTAEFNGQVRVVDDAFTLTADRLSIFSKPPLDGHGRLRSGLSGKDVGRMVAHGRVVIRSEELTASSDGAEYEPDDGRATLWGEKTPAARPAGPRGQGANVTSAVERPAGAIPPSGRVRVVIAPVAQQR